MIRLLIFVALTAALIAGAIYFADRPGEVVVIWQGYRLEGSVGVLLGALAVMTGLLVVLWRLVQLGLGSRRWLAELLGASRRRKGQRALTQSLVALAATDVDEALRQTRLVDQYLADETLTRLLTAQAADMAGNDEAARRQYHALANQPDTAFLGLRGLLALARKQGNEDAAWEFARRAHRLRPRNRGVLSTLLDLAVARRDWAVALETLKEAGKSGVLSAAEISRRRGVILLARAHEEAARGESYAALKTVKQALDAQPDQPAATALSARLQLSLGQPKKARAVIEAGWRRVPTPELAALYGDAGDADPLAQVKAFETLLAINPDHVESHLALAEAALAAKLWGAARNHLTLAMGDAPGLRVCRLMAALEEAEHGDGATARDWLMRAAQANPEPSWLCNACGAQADRWQPHCPNCDAFDGLQWRRPLRFLNAAAGSVKTAAGRLPASAA